MRTQGQATLIIVSLVVAVAVTAACAESVTTPTPGPRRTVSLVAPASGALIGQNDPNIGCPAHDKRGYGFRLDFDWKDVVGAEAYLVRLKRTGSQFPAIDHAMHESSLSMVLCNAFVIDANLTGWVWRVAAVARGDDATAMDTLWSEERTYGFLPCRHPDGTSCSAPPEP